MSRVANYIFVAPWLLLGAFFTMPAHANETCWTMGGGQFFNAMHYCVSSILPRSGKWHYGPRNLAGTEGGKHLAWCEGVRGYGVGQTITIRVNDGSSFSRLSIGNGYGKTRKSYRENSRVKDIRITTNTGINTTARLVDQNGIIPYYLPASAEYKWVKLKILSVYPGSRYHDTCLDFIFPDFEFDEELLQSGASQSNAPKPVPAPATPAPIVKAPIKQLPVVEEAVQPTKPAPAIPPVDTKRPSGKDDPFGELGMPDLDELKLPDQ